ncbi:MAG: signal peptidase II [Oscillospiraceae bacterium]|nr:signal peptidase II [Oscillospiraceae bacterium]MDD7042494.1 signal peptidase II [Oscillospiraceae bacterium]MDY2611371.1 signal peptidase II [Oscillospiraceae bacterium]
MIIGILGMMAVLIGLDQLFKYWAVIYLQPIGTVPLVSGKFHLTYVENFGAAGGILQGKQFFLILVTSVVLTGLLILLLLKKIPGRFLPWMVGVVAAGGIGNLIDRIFRGFVVDYLDFCWIHYPVFNFADCCVVVGIFVIAGYVFWNEKKQGKVEIQPPKGKEK